ncbi:aspartic peptidase domain-containing protein [Hygrophoropsis aurantiaca]|uniref:Aspartic peptidase domain-containing protein n=1 Tax=Hygrophoropsis aurantiaca TaxID=72124 RepID=A0ACB8A8A6_9AGAM|nr:aspartic peptidase domain-containing protein [Hygrophoropsis aurantiaca]
MLSLQLCFFLALILPAKTLCDVTNSAIPSNCAKRTAGGIHLPLLRQITSNTAKNASQTGAIGMGDFLDVTYNVLIEIGPVSTPVVLDTGSSDLWVLSTACGAVCSSGKEPLYPLSTFHSTNLEAQLLYGDSMTGTHASGPIGFDTISLAGLVLENQYFAAINDTNTAVLETQSAGIFGLGFPLNSIVWNQVFLTQQSPAPPAKALRSTEDTPFSVANALRNLVIKFFPKTHLNASTPSSTSSFPPSSQSSRANIKRQAASSMSNSAIFSSYTTIAPFLPRLVALGLLALPMFTVTLQRDTIDIGGNQGTLSIGELPHTVQNASLTWVPVRGYPPSQSGLAPPVDSPNEVYPIAWEIPVDDVYFDGTKLPRSSLSSPSISLSALIDTGNSLIRGPADVVSQIPMHLSCSTPHALVFQIGGKLFPVDPRDFISQARSGSVDDCVANIAATDTPILGKGYLYSWSLGDPFLKSVLAAFYYGDFARPSLDPARIGLLSTVPSDAAAKLVASVGAAKANGMDLPETTDPAPPSLPPTQSTPANGVPLAPARSGEHGDGTGGTGGEGQANGVRNAMRVNVWSVLIGLGLWVVGVGRGFV